MNRIFFTKFMNMRNCIKRNSTSLQTIVNIQQNDVIESDLVDILDNPKSKHALDIVKNEDLSEISPILPSSFNIAAYVNCSETLQKLLHMNVDLYKLDKFDDIELSSDILKLDFETNIQPHLIFLSDYVDTERLGWFITKNPRILFVNLDDLEIRINYLRSKNFNDDQIKNIVSKNPQWLMHSTLDIDERLGHYQKMFELKGYEVRILAALSPKFITYSRRHINVNNFVIKEEMGFSDKEIKQILLKVPKLWMIDQKHMLRRFNYLHNIAKIPHNLFVEFPGVLMCRNYRVKLRHLFLKKLGRDQFDPCKENYVPLIALSVGTDEEFCKTYAKCSEYDFENFQKTL